MIESSPKFGKYTLRERLAVGGMAEIFKASAGGLDGFEKIVAIKRLHRQYSEDGEFATMLIDEAKLAVRLSHANIGQIFDLGCIDDQYFIVMEYIDGLDLHELVERAVAQNRRLPLEAVLHVVSQVAEALHYAHTKMGPDGRPLEIVHRDVSPQNIMISVDGEVKLVDFGIAKARMRVQHTKAGIIKGKFYYMSPEQALGNRIDARTDVYALGMVLYEILSGGHPFDDVPDAELLKSVRMSDFAPIAHVAPHLPAALTSIVDRALMRNADRRYRSALDLQRDLEEFRDRELRHFSRVEMAELVRQYSANHLPEETRAADFQAMQRDEYAASQDSVIFDARAALAEVQPDFDEGEATQIFSRDDDYDELDVDDLVADEKTDFLDWNQSGSHQAVSASNSSEPWQNHVNQPEPAKRPASSPVPAAEATGPSPVYSPQPVRQTRIHERIATGLVTQFDYLLRRRPHVVGGVLAGVAVILLAFSAFLILGPDSDEDSVDGQWHTGGADEADSAERPTNVDLAVSTTPPNADLFVDGAFRGPTPVSLNSLEIGQGYVLRFERDGYNVKELNIVVEADQPPMVVRLEPLGGILRVETTPEGVEVFVNGTSEGPAPVTIMGLERDLAHEVEVRMSDDAVQQEVVRWGDGDERLQELRFEFEVPEERPQAAATTRRRSSSGTSRSRQPRRDPPPRAAAEPSGGGTGLNIWDIAEEVEQGRLNVRVNAEEGRIYVNDNLVQDGTVLVGHSLDPGSYDVRVYYPVFRRSSETRRVEIRAGETSTVTFSP